MRFIQQEELGTAQGRNGGGWERGGVNRSQILPDPVTRRRCILFILQALEP